MHNGFLNVDDEKMSKSLDNFFSIRDVLDSRRARSGGRAVLPRVEPLSRARQLFAAQIEQADAALTRLYTALRDIEPAESYEPSAATRQFEAAMDDDFNTPEAIAALQGLASEINRAKSANDWGKASALAAELKKLAAVLGVLHLQPEEFLRKGQSRAWPTPTSTG